MNLSLLAVEKESPFFVQNSLRLIGLLYCIPSGVGLRMAGKNKPS